MYMIVILYLGVIRIVVFKFRCILQVNERKDCNIKPYTSDERHRLLQDDRTGH
jgi:hypothetical protein